MSVKNILEKLLAHQLLDRSEALFLINAIACGGLNSSQLAAVLTVYRMRSLSLTELESFRDGILELGKPVDLSEFDPMDVCGTGGDGKNTFNISTLSAFVLAGAGLKIAKHGNHGVSGICGSSTVLESVGVRFTDDQDTLKMQLDKAGICFLHAPLFHPALRNVAEVRKELGIKTFFNMLGPLVNPARPRKQLAGVYDLELSRIYSYLYQRSGKQFTVLHSMDGYDEVSLTGQFRAVSNLGERQLGPEAFLQEKLLPKDIQGGNTKDESVTIFLNVINGKGTTAQNKVVAANAAMAISCHYPELTLPDCYQIAEESLLSGRAKRSLDTLIQFQS